MAVQNAENGVVIGGIQGRGQCHHSIERIRLPIRLYKKLYVYLLPFSVEFRGDLWRQETRLPGVSCGVVCVILRFAVLAEHRLVTDRHRQKRTQAHG